LYALAFVGSTKHAQSLKCFHPVEYVTRVVFASSTTILVASTSRIIFQQKGKQEPQSKRSQNMRITSCGEISLKRIGVCDGLRDAGVLRCSERQSMAYKQLRTWLRCKNTAVLRVRPKSYHETVPCLLKTRIVSTLPLQLGGISMNSAGLAAMKTRPGRVHCPSELPHFLSGSVVSCISLYFKFEPPLHS